MDRQGHAIHKGRIKKVGFRKGSGKLSRKQDLLGYLMALFYSSERKNRSHCSGMHAVACKSVFASKLFVSLAS